MGFDITQPGDLIQVGMGLVSNTRFYMMGTYAGYAEHEPTKKMVLLGRIELPTSPLPRVRSTTELQQRRGAIDNHGARAGARYCRAGT